MRMLDNPYLQSLMANGMNVPGSQFNAPGGTYTMSGKPATGPFQNNTNTPFRTVSGIGQYGQGLNSSAAQIYEHFSGAQNANGRKYSDHGLKPINPREQIQSIQDFRNRGSLAMPAGPSALEWGNLKNNNDVLSFMRQNGALGSDSLNWMGRWFGESGIGGGKDFLTGNVRHWDYMNSGLTDANKGIVGNAMNYLNQFWSPLEQGQGMPADPAPAVPPGGIFNFDPDTIASIMGGMR